VSPLRRSGEGEEGEDEEIEDREVYRDAINKMS